MAVRHYGATRQVFGGRKTKPPQGPPHRPGLRPGHLSPLRGARKGAGPVSLVPRMTGAKPKLRFLSPGQGERWHAEHNGEGVLGRDFRVQERDA